MSSAVLLLLVVTASADRLQPGDHTRTLTVEKRERTYLVHVPKSYDDTKPTPVVLAFHGGGSHAEQMVRLCGLNEKADKEGFIAVYPSGTGRLPRMLTWNGGNCCGYAMQNKVDDVAFVRALLDELTKIATIDQKRIYATGMSNGAIISYRLASELSDRIAAIAPVAGPMGTETCSPKRPVSVMHFHGTDDEFAAFKGGPGPKSFSRTNFYSVEHSIQAWVKANGSPAEPKVEQLPDKADDGMTVTRKTYGPGRDGSEVVLLVIEALQRDDLRLLGRPQRHGRQDLSHLGIRDGFQDHCAASSARHVTTSQDLSLFLQLHERFVGGNDDPFDMVKKTLGVLGKRLAQFHRHQILHGAPPFLIGWGPATIMVHTRHRPSVDQRHDCPDLLSILSILLPVGALQLLLFNRNEQEDDNHQGTKQQ